AIDELRKAVLAQPRQDGATPTDTTLLMADLTRAAYEQTRSDLEAATERLTKQVKRAVSALREAQDLQGGRLDQVVTKVDALGRLPHPGGPQLVPVAMDKALAVNDTVQRSVGPELATELRQWQELTKSTDQTLATEAQRRVRMLLQQHGLTG
ncbi:MAG TPA: hypothetical protein VJ741_15710, partial [Solirubrobacteraceae bacterium]|nr:hypothetical protein [Solirubrobacteraceae bacterium]